MVTGVGMVSQVTMSLAVVGWVFTPNNITTPVDGRVVRDSCPNLCFWLTEALCMALCHSTPPHQAHPIHAHSRGYGVFCLCSESSKTSSAVEFHFTVFSLSSVSADSTQVLHLSKSYVSRLQRFPAPRPNLLRTNFQAPHYSPIVMDANTQDRWQPSLQSNFIQSLVITDTLIIFLTWHIPIWYSFLEHLPSQGNLPK